MKSKDFISWISKQQDKQIIKKTYYTDMMLCKYQRQFARFMDRQYYSSFYLPF